ncbi:MAG: LytR/AlgR family response regulator transcription factor [Dermatophilaceae bacterium]
MSSIGVGLTALVVDDELPALTDLGYLLGRDHRVAEVITAACGTDALAALDRRDIDVVFSDISMPGLDGLALARVISRFAVRPHVVFVTAHDQHAVDAFALAATDYVMKPVRESRLAEAIRRVAAAQEPPGHRPDGTGPPVLLAPHSGSRVPHPTRPPGSTAPHDVLADDDDSPFAGHSPPTGAPRSTHDQTIPVELGGVTRFITRNQVRYAQAHGDYARLHTSSGSHLVRIPLGTLEEEWADYGFVRIHRSTLVALPHIREVRIDHGRCAVLVGDVELPVSRRHTKGLRDTLLRRPLGGLRPPGA